MSNVYDSIEIEDMTWDPVTQIFLYPCPCGDQFQISIDDMVEGETIATCPSCSLMIEVIFESEDLEKFKESDAAVLRNNANLVSVPQ